MAASVMARPYSSDMGMKFSTTRECYLRTMDSKSSINNVADHGQRRTIRGYRDWGNNTAMPSSSTASSSGKESFPDFDDAKLVM
jgi:hypothetical protein